MIEDFYDFKPDSRARRISSTETFRNTITWTITWTRAQLRQLAEPDCAICLGSGVLEAVEPKPCTCCWGER